MLTQSLFENASINLFVNYGTRLPAGQGGEKKNQRTRVLISCHGLYSLKRIEAFLGVGLFGQTLNKSNKLNVTPISMQLQDNAQPKEKKINFFLIVLNI
jgi:hypothetical protein